jgi:hypothetical protein
VLIEHTGSYGTPFMLAAFVIAAGPLALWLVRLSGSRQTAR